MPSTCPRSTTATCRAAPSSLVVDVSVPGSPTLSVAGTVVEPRDPPGSFVANWWAATSTGSVKMSTSVPVISVGSASHTLTTNAADPLGQLISGSSIGFPILEQFNTYPAATLQVTSNSPGGGDRSDRLHAPAPSLPRNVPLEGGPSTDVDSTVGVGTRFALTLPHTGAPASVEEPRPR